MLHSLPRTRAVHCTVAILLLVLGHISLQAWMASPAIALSPASVDVIGDDENDVFVGSGSLLLPGSMYSDGRETAASCPGCQWKAVLECDLTSASACRGPARLCGAEGAWLRIWMAPPGGAWQDLGAACFGTGGPVRRDVAEMALRDLIVQSVPPLRPTSQPAARVLPHLPVAFQSGQPDGPRSSDHLILGLSVHLVIEPQWLWDFGDGERRASDVPGGRWPDLSVSHTYRFAGALRAQVQTRWDAQYTVEGIGPLQVAEPVRQQASVAVPVGEGRAILVR